MKRDGDEAAKRRAGESAAATVEDGMVVGLGTGSTTAHAIRALGRAVDDGIDVAGIPTSYQTRALAQGAGVPLTSLSEGTPDVAIDGADQVVGGTLVKGGGAAHAREKVVDAAAERLVVVVDEEKLADGVDAAVPIEVLPAARPTVASAVRALGGDPDLRAAAQKDGPVVTDNGNLVVDVDFGRIATPDDLAREIAALPGVVEHGLFVDLVDEIHVGSAVGVEVREF
ncbi:MAG: ribose-5-phosphate isomerase RpiA [Haloarculaceae archaeon]